MAEHIARYEIEKRVLDIEVDSAGFWGTGDRAAENSIAACSEIDIDLSFHLSKNLNRPLADSADIIACMEESHAMQLVSLGIKSEKLRVFNIRDPFGHPLDVYVKCRDAIYSEVCKLLDELREYIEIIPLEKDHAPALAALEQQCFSDPWSEEGIAFEADNDAAKFFVAKCGGEIAGYAGMLYAADLGNICNIAVYPQYRNKGIGKKLVSALIDSARELGVAELTLEVRETNEIAQNLYRSFGFKEAGKRKGFYNSPSEDAIVMNLSL